MELPSKKADLSSTNKDDLLKRLRKIEGQIRGIQRMISEERPCQDLLMQLAAVKSAVVQVAMIILGNQMRSCLFQELEGEGDQSMAMSKFMEIFKKFS